MRLLLAGLACLLVGLGLTEYARRHPASADGGPAAAPSAPPPRPQATTALLALGPAEAMTSAPTAPFAALVAQGQALVDGFSVAATGPFAARELRGGFDAALFVMDLEGGSAVVRAAPGQPPRVLLAREAPITRLVVDGSTLFFAEGGLIASTSTRGDEGLTVRARFANAVVTGLAASGDTVVAALVPPGTGPASAAPVGAVVRLDASGVTLLAADQVAPRAVVTDGKEAWWLAGQPAALWRGALDGAFSAQLAADVAEPLVLDGDALVHRAVAASGPELRRVGRAGGNLQTLATRNPEWLAAASGLVRFTEGGALYEVTPGSEPTLRATFPGAAQGVALGGTTLFVLVREGGASHLYAK